MTSHALCCLHSLVSAVSLSSLCLLSCAGMLHGMARAVSGGAVYVSDKPGQHDFTLLRRLVLPDGRVLRAQLPGRPTRDCLFMDVLRDNKTMLKVGRGARGSTVDNFSWLGL